MVSQCVKWVWSLFVFCTGVCNLAADEVILFPGDATVTRGIVQSETVLQYKRLDTSATWSFDVESAGDYNIFAEIGCIGWGRGSEFEIRIDDEPVNVYTVPNTGNNLVIEKLSGSSVDLSAGSHTFAIVPVKTKNAAYMGRSRLIHITKQASLPEIVDSSYYVKGDSFAATMAALRSAHPELSSFLQCETVYKKLWGDFPHEMSWMLQDCVDAEEARKNPKLDTQGALVRFFAADRDSSFEMQLIERALAELDDAAVAVFRAELAGLKKCPPSDSRWLSLYETVCKARRAQRLKPLLAKTSSIIFAKHQVFGSQSGIYNITETEGLNPGEVSALCQIQLAPEKDGVFATVETLKDPEGGMLRDPELSYDAKRLLFAWRQTTQNRGTTGVSAPDTGNYQIYEMELATGKIRQLTDDLTYGANYEPCYLPNGNILFNSARIVQEITCGWGDHSNLFVMNGDGKYQRRLGFDQVSTQFPTVLNNGQVVFLRRDYNDRGQSSAHSLIVMNLDGTGQTEFYGNQTGLPNSFMHPRAISGSDKVVCVLSGYHTRQGGQLALVDIRKGRNYGEGVTQLPQRTAPPSGPGYDDGYLKDQVQYANPYPLSETEFIVSRSDVWCSSKTGGGLGEQYGIYFMMADGRRELLAYDATTSCLQPVPVMTRPQPPVRPSQTDYTKKTGVYYVQNVYLGAAAEGITSKVKKLRVVEILYKHATVNSGTSSGPGGAADTVTPPAHPLALFDAKRIIGEATVYEDGSAMFEVPARTPVYFQLLDEKNRCVQTMRSWTTLMPRENFSCVGCHEDKNETPVSSTRTMAMAHGVEKLTPFYGEPRGFSFMKEVQPILDRHCVSCHDFKADGTPKNKLVLTAEPFEDAPKYGRTYAQSYVQLMAARPGPDPEKFAVWGGPESWNRRGKAMADEPNRYVRYWTRLGTMGPVAPYTAGSVVSGMIQRLEEGHKKVNLSPEEWDKLCAWIDLNCPYSGDYMEGNIWQPNQLKHYKDRIDERKRNEDIEAQAIAEFIKAGQP